MAEAFTHFGGIDFSGAREPLSNLWSAVGTESDGRLRIESVRPHAYRKDLGAYVTGGWRSGADDPHLRILWGVDFPFGLPAAVVDSIVPGRGWIDVIDWVADRPADEVRSAAGGSVRALRETDVDGALAPLDLRLFKQTVEGFRWLQELRDLESVSIHPQAVLPNTPVSLVEVYPSSTVKELGLPRRRTPSRPGEVRARAAALRTFVEFGTSDAECLAVTLEDAWDAVVACLTAYLCRDDLDQPFRIAESAKSRVEREGWIYRPPATLA